MKLLMASAPPWARIARRARCIGSESTSCPVSLRAKYAFTIPRGLSDELRVLGRREGTTVFITLPNTKIELLEPLGENSPIAKFLEKNPDGGIHHVCYEVEDIRAARDSLKAQGARVLGDGEPKIGAHGKPVLFLHPKDFCGTLVELEQA